MGTNVRKNKNIQLADNGVLLMFFSFQLNYITKRNCKLTFS